MKLTESAAWRAMAKELSANALEGYYPGLCIAAQRYSETDPAMWYRVRQHRRDSRLDSKDFYGFMWPLDAEHAQARILAALFLSLEAKEEGR